MSFHDPEFDRLDAALREFNEELSEFRVLASPLVESEPVRRRDWAPSEQEGSKPVEVAQRLTVRVCNGGAGPSVAGGSAPFLSEPESSPAVASFFSRLWKDTRALFHPAAVLFAANALIAGMVVGASHPAAALKIVAGLGLILGSGLIFLALVRLDR